MPSSGVVAVTGTGTGVGKTVVTAALAVLALRAGRRVAVLKPAQTGVGADAPGDVDEVVRLAGGVHPVELVRYAEPLAPATAARRAGEDGISVADTAKAAQRLRAHHDLVLVEGAGGVLVRFDAAGGTLADLAAAMAAPAVVVVRAGLGTLSDTALTTEALRARGVRRCGLVIGEWPDGPDLAARCNRADLPEVAGAPLWGALPEGAARLPPEEFRRSAAHWLEAAAAEGGGVSTAGPRNAA